MEITEGVLAFSYEPMKSGEAGGGCCHVIVTCWTLFDFGAITHRLRRYFRPVFALPDTVALMRGKNDCILTVRPFSGHLSSPEEAQAPAAHFQTGPDWRLRLQ